MKVRSVPTELRTVAASIAKLAPEELVLGVVRGGKAIAYPIRYLSMYEIVDHRVGDTPIAPTW
jgi:hypothetical protein